MHASRLVALVALCFMTPQRDPAPDPASGVAVRHTEGTVHGFLRLSTADGRRLADGDLLQVVRGDTIDSRMVFDFADSSVFEESVSFTQRGVFTLVQYDLVQRGPAFVRHEGPLYLGPVWRIDLVGPTLSP